MPSVLKIISSSRAVSAVASTIGNVVGSSARQSMNRVPRRSFHPSLPGATMTPVPDAAKQFQDKIGELRAHVAEERAKSAILLSTIEEHKAERREVRQEIKDEKATAIGLVGKRDFMFVQSALKPGGRITDEHLVTRMNRLSGQDIDDFTSVIASVESLLDLEKTLENLDRRIEDCLNDVRNIDAHIRELGERVVYYEAKIEAIMTRNAPISDKFAPYLPGMGGSGMGGGNVTKASNLVNFPASPMRTRKLPFDVLLDYCDKQGYLDKLSHNNTSISVENTLIAADCLYAGNEGTITGPASNLLATVLKAMKTSTPESVISPELTCYMGSSSNFVGNPDFMIAKEEVQDSNESKLFPLLAGELKGPGYTETNLFEKYCDHTCKNVNCGSQRHNPCSVIRQLYNYMVTNGLLVGICTNYYNTAVFIRDCSGNLLITPSVASTRGGDLDAKSPSATQLIALAIMISEERTVPELGDGDEVVLVKCDGRECNNHTRLPEECKHENDAYKNGNKPTHQDHQEYRDRRMQIFGFSLTSNDEPIAFLELGPYVGLPEGRTGKTLRISLPHGEKGKVDGVLKILDTFKQSDQIKEIDHEATIYKKLSALQGTCIPEFVDYGMFKEGFLYGLGTTYAGDSVSNEDVTDEFLAKAVAALEKIHSYGVLHGDVRRENIVCNKEAGNAPVIIDFGMAIDAEEEKLTPEEFEKRAEGEIVQLRRSLAR